MVENVKKSFRNLVSKYARMFNKAKVFKDKTKYSRKKKHRNKDD